jgi:predicted CoA-binding protein
MTKDMNIVVDEFLKCKNFAVIGVSRNQEKYGYQVFRNLSDKGYNVYPVNPKIDEIDGKKVYPSLAAIEKPVDVVDLVVPPTITEEVVRQCKDLGITKIWMQPGAESQAAIDFCKENDMDVVHGMCVMVMAPHSE